MKISKSVIKLNRENLFESSTSSKGNQPKYQVSDLWYKLDDLGYEALAEVFSYRIAKEINFPFEILKYELAKVQTDDFSVTTSCVSKTFTSDGITETSFIRIFKNEFNEDIYDSIDKMTNIKDRIKYVSEKLNTLNGIDNAGEYITGILQFDALILNEDRHFHNFTLLYNENNNSYSYTPLFDNGAGFLSDMKWDYPLYIPIEIAQRKVKSKPFTNSFSKQVQAATELYGSQILPPEKIDIYIGDFYDYYDEEIIKRICCIIKTTMKTYFPSTSIVLKK